MPFIVIYVAALFDHLMLFLEDGKIFQRAGILHAGICFFSTMCELLYVNRKYYLGLILDHLDNRN